MRDEGTTEEIERWERVCAELLKIKDEIVKGHDKLPQQEEILLKTFRKLNPEGQQRILGIADDYAKIQDYTTSGP